MSRIVFYAGVLTFLWAFNYVQSKAELAARSTPLPEKEPAAVFIGVPVQQVRASILTSF